jgi:nucleoside-diphosphate-sugar epimerase
LIQAKTLLIIGGTGFFAKSLIDYIHNCTFSSKINKIFLLSRSIKKINIKKKLNNRIEIKAIRADISKLKKIPFADYIIYCAINHDYVEDHKSVCNYYKLAKKYHSKSKILYTSSGAVYGQQPKNIKKLSENYLVNNKRINFKSTDKNSYSLTKLKNERVFQKLSELKIKVSIARCFAFVGKYLPRDSNFAVGNLIQNILKKKDLEIKSDHYVIRSYMHEHDLSRWLLEIVKNAKTNCPIYNVGSDKAAKIQDLAYALSKKYKLNLKLKNIKLSIEDKYVPSIQKAKKELKLKLKYNNLDAVNDVIHSIQNKL